MEQLSSRVRAGKIPWKYTRALTPRQSGKLRIKPAALRRLQPLPSFSSPAPQTNPTRSGSILKTKPLAGLFQHLDFLFEGQRMEGSVDLEAFEMAKKLGRESISWRPFERAGSGPRNGSPGRMINFLKKVRHWIEYSESYVQVYLRDPYPTGWPGRAICPPGSRSSTNATGFF